MGGEVVNDIVYNSDPDYLVQKLGYGNSYRKLYGAYSGAVLVLGMGPSRKKILGRKLSIPVIAINKAAEEYPEADFWLAHDRASIKFLGERVKPGMPMLTHSYNVYQPEWEKRGSRPVYFYEIACSSEPRKDAKLPLYWNESSFGLAMSLAPRMGFTTVYTLGIDMTTGGYTSYSMGPDEMETQHKSVANKIMSMFRDSEIPKWRLWPFKIIDLSGGKLPVEKGSINDFLETYEVPVGPALEKHS